MLVLSRTRGQAIMIGDEVEITLIDVRGDKVRLGVNAPRSVPVHRKEIFDAIHHENAQAARLTPEDVAGLVPPAQVTPAPPPFPRLADGARPSDPFLAMALEEAIRSRSEGGLPIGAVLVEHDRVVGAGHNRRVQSNDPMAHAEITALRNAGRRASYKSTTLYSTLAPCHLCAGAVVQFGIPKVVVGDSTHFPGALDHLRQHGVEVVELHDPACADLIRRFIAENPALWREDIGEEKK